MRRFAVSWRADFEMLSTSGGAWFKTDAFSGTKAAKEDSASSGDTSRWRTVGSPKTAPSVEAQTTTPPMAMNFDRCSRNFGFNSLMLSCKIENVR